MNWKLAKVSEDGTHHLSGGAPLYAERFDSVLKFHEPGLAPVQKDLEAWHISLDGKAAYQSRFLHTFGYYNGLAAVMDDEGWHHITPTGVETYPARYAWCGNFQNGLCTVRRFDGTYIHITMDGSPAYPQAWSYAGDFRDGVAVVQREDGLSTHISLEGHLLHDRWFLDLDVFHKGFARARDDAGWMHVTSDGVPNFGRRFANVEPYYNGQARVEGFDGSLEIINESGETLHQLRLARRSEFSALSEDMVGFWRTQTIAAGVALGVIECLPNSTYDIAVHCALHLGRTERLLNALGELQLVCRKSGLWELTSRGQFLRADHPLTLSGAAVEYAGPLLTMWQELPMAMLKEGRWKKPTIFSDMAGDEDRLRAHHQMLQSYARHDYLGIASGLGLNGTEHVLDAGGGVGTLALVLKESLPELTVTVFDRPEVIRQAQSFCGEKSGLQFESGDLFEGWNSVADVVLLTRILHDWDDSDALRILRTVRKGISPGGRVVIVEMLLPDVGMAGSLCDLHLLMVTGGQDRTAKAYEKLLAQAGFSITEMKTHSSLSSIIVGVVNPQEEAAL